MDMSKESLHGTMHNAGLSEQDAVRDAYVAELEAALRVIAAPPTLGASIARTLDQRILIAREVLGMAEVERIPDGVSFPPRGEVAFTRYPVPGGAWHLIGPADRLERGSVIEVRKFGEREPTLVAVGQTVAERTVFHRDAGAVRYVVARISRAVRD